ncbi:oligosaccharide flippase family protein [uncultured Agrobacterium sp.]|uniref:oligosaccharide flippase family protein n=1 Tax=uncultured Agrobacterium sp. TaxID=157277 RepID=UPI0025E58304|nr:oligosaccharide flippase family protein [uncultured Agrobacterium sp.]
MTKAVKEKAISATLWSIVRIGVDQLFSFLVFIVVARLLGPVDVGIFALGMIFAELTRIFATSGFADAVTKASPEQEEVVACAAFWSNMVVAIACSLIVTLVAATAGKYVSTDRLAEVIIALAWTIPLSAGSAIHMARCLKRFGHKALAIRAIVSGLAGGAVAVAAAFQGYGVWALVLQRFVTELITLITAWLAYRWVPTFHFTSTDLKEILPFSMKMSFTKFIALIASRVQDVVIGAFVGPAAVGMYRIAKKTIDILMTATLTPLSTVATNFFVAVRDDATRFQQSFVKLVTVSSCIAFPAFFGLAAVADVVVPLVYGPKWNEAIPILQLLAPICIPLVISLYILPVLTVFGEASKAARMTVIQLFLSLAFALIAAPFGVYPVVIGFLLRAYLMIPYQLRLIEKHTNCSVNRIIVYIGKPLGASVMTSLICYYSLNYVYRIEFNDIISLILAIVQSAVLYIIMLLVVDRRSVRWLIEIFQSILRKGRRNTMKHPNPV